CGCPCSAERVPARAASCRVRIVDREALLLDGVFEVDACPVEVGNTHLVDNHFDPVELDGGIAIEQTLIEVELVDESRAAAGLYGNSQTQVIAALLFIEGEHLGDGSVGERDPVSR